MLFPDTADMSQGLSFAGGLGRPDACTEAFPCSQDPSPTASRAADTEEPGRRCLSILETRDPGSECGVCWGGWVSVRGTGVSTSLAENLQNLPCLGPGISPQGLLRRWFCDLMVSVYRLLSCRHKGVHGLSFGAAQKYECLGDQGGRWEDKFHPEQQVGVEVKMEKKVQWVEP